MSVFGIKKYPYKSMTWGCEIISHTFVPGLCESGSHDFANRDKQTAKPYGVWGVLCGNQNTRFHRATVWLCERICNTHSTKPQGHKSAFFYDDFLPRGMA